MPHRNVHTVAKPLTNLRQRILLREISQRTCPQIMKQTRPTLDTNLFDVPRKLSPEVFALNRT